MGAKGSKLNSTKAQEAKLDISTVSMALDSHGKLRSCKDPAAPSSGFDSQAYAMHKYPTGQQQQTPNQSSVRFGGPSERATDLNGNLHFCPGSVGKNSLSSSAVAEDPNNNHVNNCERSTASKASLRSKQPERPYRTDSPTIAHEPRRPSHYSYSAGIAPSHSTDKMARRGSGARKSASFVVVFLVELLSLLGLAALAFLLRYTDHIFTVLKRIFDCTDSSLNQPKEPPLYKDIIFHDITGDNFYLIFLLAPIGVIVALEVIRQFILIGLAHSASNESIIQKKLGRMPFAVYIRRIIRFTGGFLLGALMTSILVDVLKYQTGSPRPFFVKACPLVNQTYCIPENVCTEHEAKEARMSFPSMTAGMSSYAALFLVLYLSFALPYRGMRFVRVWLVLGIALVVALVFNARLSTNQSHVQDMIVGLLIGLFFALYIVFIHLNAFANRLSNSNFLGANRAAPDRVSEAEGQLDIASQLDEVSHSNLFADNDKDWFWKNFHIPRVHTLRQSARNMWRKTDNYLSGRPAADSLSNQTPGASHKPTNAYINPAFNGRDDGILTNHLSHDARLTARDSFNSAHTGSNNPRTNLRTFQANS